MRELDCRLQGRRYIFPVAIFGADSPTDLTHVSGNALLDTGATVSGIGPRIIESLGLVSVAKKPLRSATEEVFSDYYVFRIGLFTTEQLQTTKPDPTDLPYIIAEVNGFSWKRPGDFDIILGMDVISRCDISLVRSGNCRIVFA